MSRQGGVIASITNHQGTSPVNDQASAVSYLVQISYLGSIVLDIRIDGYVVYIIVDIKV